MEPFLIGSLLALAGISGLLYYAYRRGWVDTKWLKPPTQIDEAEEFIRGLRQLRNRSTTFADRYDNPDYVAAALRRKTVADYEQYIDEVSNIVEVLTDSADRINASAEYAIAIVGKKSRLTAEEPTAQPTVTRVESPQPRYTPYTAYTPPAVDVAPSAFDDNEVYVWRPVNSEKVEQASGRDLNNVIRTGKGRLNKDFFVLGTAAEYMSRQYNTNVASR